MQREYCCTNCGLIWFDEKLSLNKGVICPECNNNGNTKRLFACDSLAWFYASLATVEILKENGKKIHYHKDHPWHHK